MDRRRFLVGVAAGVLVGATGGLFSGGEERRTYSRSPLARLSPRERQVLALRARGWSNAQIGREPLLSPFAVSVFTQNGLEKLAMHSG